MHRVRIKHSVRVEYWEIISLAFSSCNISPYSTLTHVISIIYSTYVSDHPVPLHAARSMLLVVPSKPAQSAHLRNTDWPSNLTVCGAHCLRDTQTSFCLVPRYHKAHHVPILGDTCLHNLTGNNNNKHAIKSRPQTMGNIAYFVWTVLSAL